MENRITATAENTPVNTAANTWFGLSASIDDLIYEYASRRYYFTLTGDADGTTDIQIPISSMQCRRRSGDPTYLSVVVPDIGTYYSEIVARANGDMVIEMAYWFNNEDNFRTEIARGTMTDPRLDQGGSSQSLTLTGYKTETWVPKTATADGASTYRSLTKGKITHRMAEPDIFINPGDTVTIDDDTFVVGNLSITIGSMIQNMEVVEA